MNYFDSWNMTDHCKCDLLECWMPGCHGTVLDIIYYSNYEIFKNQLQQIIGTPDIPRINMSQINCHLNWSSSYMIVEKQGLIGEAIGIPVVASYLDLYMFWILQVKINPWTKHRSLEFTDDTSLKMSVVSLSLIQENFSWLFFGAL